MAKRQSVSATAIVKEFAFSLDKSSARKSASQRTICFWMSSGPAPFEISRLECSLCTTGIEYYDTGTTTVGTGWVGVGLASPLREINEEKSFSNSALADGVKIVSPLLSFIQIIVPIPTHVDEEQLWLGLGLKSQLFFVLLIGIFHQFRKHIWFFTVRLEQISRCAALVLDEHQMFNFLGTFVFRSERGKDSSSSHNNMTWTIKNFSSFNL